MTADASVSVVIPTFNRFSAVLRAIESVRAQTVSAAEIIVVNDASTQQEYYAQDWASDVRLLHLDESEPGRRTPGSRARNAGMEAATGTYIAFLDDDDVWLPGKLRAQLAAMGETGCAMSCTEALLGYGPFDRRAEYPRYNADYYLDQIRDIHRRKRSTMLEEGFPGIWTRAFLATHNSAVTSSVVVRRDISRRVGLFRLLRSGEDYDYWLRVLKHTDCVYVAEPQVYYDNDHAGGRHYSS